MIEIWLVGTEEARKRGLEPKIYREISSDRIHDQSLALVQLLPPPPTPFSLRSFDDEKMILEEANKVVQWEQTLELARREAMQQAAEMRGHGGSFAAGAQHEKNELMQAMMSQKVDIMLLSTVRARAKCFVA